MVMYNKANEKNFPIGVLDSGVGGLTTLATLKKLLPNENFIFYADHKNAPYGDKDKEEVKEFVHEIVKFFISKKVKAIVIACNTAVSATIEHLRKEFNIPIFGLEPAVKIAYENSKDKKIILMATKLTTQGEKLKSLLKKLNIENEVKKIPASGLVELIEAENYSSQKIKTYLKNIFKNLNINDYSHLVLGCTHYIFVKNEINQVINSKLEITDGNKGLALHLKRTLKKHSLLNNSDKEGYIKLITSGNKKDEEKLRIFFEKALKITEL